MAGLCLLLFFLVLCEGIMTDEVTLKQVLVVSRHNVRAPITSNLDKFSTKSWPTFDEEPAYLTKKGALLESYMGEYFSAWLADEKLLMGCPDDGEVFIYSNTKPRTIDTATAFSKTAFKNCNVTVHHKNTTAFDPLFFPILHNTSKRFLGKVFKEMQMKLDAADLKDAYKELNTILDIKNSDVCKNESLCDLSAADNKIYYKDNEETGVIGPLGDGNSIVDTFIMSYYDGKPINEVAWGLIKDQEQWKVLTKITREHQNVRFNLTSSSRDVAGPLLGYMFKILKSDKSPKFTLLMGHDANLNPIINALGFKPYELEGQHEPFPVGGKLVFQRWSGGEKDFLKIEYVYQTFSKLRDGVPMSLSNPPKRVLMELENCKTNENGFCPWSEFMKFDTNKL